MKIACVTPRRRTVLASLGLCLIAPAGWGQSRPTGKIVLTIAGAVGKPNQGKDAVFDMRMLEALPQVTHTVETPWYPRKVSFSGPLARDVLAAAGVNPDGPTTPSSVRAIAINDYKVDIPLSDFTRHPVILATRMNGNPMSSRDKGPLFVIYPYANFGATERKQYFDRSVWQLDRLQIGT